MLHGDGEGPLQVMAGDGMLSINAPEDQEVWSGSFGAITLCARETDSDALQLQGPGVRTLLAKGCTLDLHPSVFTISSCAQSGLAKANVLLCLADEAPTFIVVVRRSFADYLCRWLAHAGRDMGIAFTAD